LHVSARIRFENEQVLAVDITVCLTDLLPSFWYAVGIVQSADRTVASSFAATVAKKVRFSGTMLGAAARHVIAANGLRVLFSTTAGRTA
jgi:hypothetical protein